MASDEITGTDESSSIPACIQFIKKGENGRLLVAVVNPNLEYPKGLDSGTIRKWIDEQGCDNWFLNGETIRLLSTEISKLEQTKEYIVAEQNDCVIEIQKSADRLKAWIHVLPAYGGASLTEDMLRKTLEDKGIRFGINEVQLQHILQDGACERELIAEGKPPIQGQNAGFEQLVKESDHKGVPQERADGKVDYKDLGLFISVTPGTPLLKRIPPTEGTPGTGIDGAPIPPPPATDRTPHPGPGTALSEDDPNIVVALRAGQPSYIENSVRVDPTLEVESVDPSTGNVEFDGNILVRGPVESGFTVKAGQDLTILDTVEGADLIAGKNMMLLTGVYGRGKSGISAGGNLEARFLSDCTIRCGGDMAVTDLIAHCDVVCEGTLQVGKHGGKGQISGGKLLVLREVRAHILGTVSETLTVIEIGPSHELIHRQAKAEQEIVLLEQELGNIEKELIAIEISPAGREHLSQTLNQKGEEVFEKLNERKREKTILDEKMEASHKGGVRAAEVHRGVVLSIGSHRQTVTEQITDLFFHTPLEEKPPE